MASSRGTIDPGTGRVVTALNTLGDPHHSLPVVHVTGTNGKGSVCAYLSSIFQRGRFRVGRFTSPHLHHPSDSIAIDGRPMAKEDYNATATEVLHRCQSIDLTNFELQFVVAIVYFAREKVEVGVIEVGLGGLEDATNVFECPLATVITSVALDHEKFLGDSLESIARHKAGIMKANCPMFIPKDANMISDGARAVIMETATDINPSCVREVHTAQWHEGLPGVAVFTEAEGQKEGGMQVPVMEYRLRLRGDYQKTNSALAIAVVRYLRNELPSLYKDSKEKTPEAPSGNSNSCSIVPSMQQPAMNAAKQFVLTYDLNERLDDRVIGEGIGLTQWPGRLEVVEVRSGLTAGTTSVNRRMNNAIEVLVDGAHNPAAARELAKYIDEITRKGPMHHNHAPGNLRGSAASQRPPVRYIMAITQGKDVEGILRPLLKPGDIFMATEFNGPVDMPWIKVMDPEELAEKASQIEPDLGACRSGPNLRLALASMQISRRSESSLLVVCGSLYLVSELLSKYKTS